MAPHFSGCRIKCPFYTVEHIENVRVLHLMCHEVPFGWDIRCKMFLDNYGCGCGWAVPEKKKGTKIQPKAFLTKVFENLRKILLVSVKFVSAILGPEMAAPILWTPGKNAFFLQENLHVHKIPRFGGGGNLVLVLGGGGGSADFIFMGAGIFLRIPWGRGCPRLRVKDVRAKMLVFFPGF